MGRVAGADPRPQEELGVIPADAELAGRPTLVQGSSQLFFRCTRRLSENSVINVKNKSHAVTAQDDDHLISPDERLRVAMARQ